jgi:hypothetical protein
LNTGNQEVKEGYYEWYNEKMASLQVSSFVYYIQVLVCLFFFFALIYMRLSLYITSLSLSLNFFFSRLSGLPFAPKKQYKGTRKGDQ